MKRTYMMNTRDKDVRQSTGCPLASVWNKAVRRVLSALMMIGALMMLVSFTSRPQGRDVDGREDSVAVDNDSVVPVIAFFSKNDTMTYWMSEATWDVKGSDTTRTTSISTKVMINVTDSTKKGYKMAYTFLDFKTDTLQDSWKQNLMNGVLDKFRNVLQGTTIRFRTDIYGKIVKYDNLDEIEKQARQLLLTTLQEMPIMDSLASAGVDMASIVKDVNMDKWVKGYVEEIELLFKYHGQQYNIGSKTEHSDATEDEYESDSYVSVSTDPETDGYKIVADVNNYIPKDDLKALVVGLASTYLDEEDSKKMKEDMDKDLDKQVTQDLLYNTYLSMEYFYDGWPSVVIQQEKRMLGDRGSLSQKYITWNYRSVRH